MESGENLHQLVEAAKAGVTELATDPKTAKRTADFVEANLPTRKSSRPERT